MVSIREIIGETIYYLVRPLVFYGGFLLIFLGIIAMFIAPLFIIVLSVKPAETFFTATGFDGKRLLIGFLIWVGIIVILLLGRRPWEDNYNKLEQEEVQGKLRLLFPAWLPTYEGKRSPIHLFPFFWHAYCPKCHKRGEIQIWNSFRYFACSCNYRWTAQDNVIT